MARQLPPNHGSWLSFGQRQNSHIVFFSISPSPKRPTPRKASFRAAELPPSGFESGEIRAREPRRITSLHTRAPFVAYRAAHRSAAPGALRRASCAATPGRVHTPVRSASVTTRHQQPPKMGAQRLCPQPKMAAQRLCPQPKMAAQRLCPQPKMGAQRLSAKS